jgi:hypothetical protein
MLAAVVIHLLRRRQTARTTDTRDARVRAADLGDPPV